MLLLRKNKKNFLLIFFLFCNVLFAGNKNILFITVTNILENKGNLMLAIYTNDSGFPDNSDNAIFKEYYKMTNMQKNQKYVNLKISLSSNSYYAAAVIHDINGDKKYNKSFLGFPLEPWGTSRNAQARFGPPQYLDAAFLFPVTNKIIIILNQ